MWKHLIQDAHHKRLALFVLEDRLNNEIGNLMTAKVNQMPLEYSIHDILEILCAHFL